MENKKNVAVENAAEDTIDLLEIFRALYRRWVWIVFNVWKICCKRCISGRGINVHY